MKKPISKQKRARLNTICPYYTMYPLEFPYHHLRKARRGDWVLDPFCGRGTTNFAARLRGLRSVGIDTNPVAVATASAKLCSVDADRVVALCHQILKTGRVGHIPRGEFWRWCYDASTLRDICKLRTELLKDSTSNVRKVLRATVLGVLHGPKMKTTTSYLSNQMPRTYSTKPGAAVRFWKKRNMKPERVDLVGVVRRKLAALTDVPEPTGGLIMRADSRNLEQRKPGPRFRWIVTSPPYLGMRTYYTDQWLRNWFMGGPDAPDYRNLKQLGQDSVEKFTADLAKVWRGVAKHSSVGARLVVRFGGIPSKKAAPSDILKKSIADAGAGWVVRAVVPAGTAADGRRQADQFLLKSGKVVEEIDLHAILRRKQHVRSRKASSTQRSGSRTHGGRRRAS